MIEHVVRAMLCPSMQEQHMGVQSTATTRSIGPSGALQAKEAAAAAALAAVVETKQNWGGGGGGGGGGICGGNCSSQVYEQELQCRSLHSRRLCPCQSSTDKDVRS